MATTVGGIVREGIVVPNSPLPEGARVEIRVCEPSETPAELQVDFDAWDRASVDALELVDRLAEDGGVHE
jgi:hypothetical protein